MTTVETIILTEEDIDRTVKRLTHEMLEANHGSKDLVLIGLVTRGKQLAERIGRYLEETEHHPVPVGYLDVTLYRDDTVHTFKPAGNSVIPVDISGKTVILVDDVIFKGRTVRAALDALTAYGRPASVQLLVLLDRGHRELPISPNYVGRMIPTSVTERVNVQLREVDGKEQVTILK
jgi:pyrimidine operon attenuation protein/uracil phosphoribosyltransferase